MPSSAPVEQMFSLATHINSAKRNRITILRYGDTKCEYMAVLRGNMHSMLNVFVIIIIVYLFIILQLLL